jgi:hypothetical protein
MEHMDWKLFFKVWMDKLEETWFRYFSNDALGTKDAWGHLLLWGVLFIPLVFAIIFILTGFMDPMRFCVKWFLWELGLFCVIWIIVYIYHNQKMKKFDNHWK